MYNIYYNKPQRYSFFNMVGHKNFFFMKKRRPTLPHKP